MKVNKTPEKIYLYPYSTDGIYEVETKSLEGTTEYTRTDAFIEKACEWWENEFTYPSMTSEEIEWYKQKVNDFRKAMKE
jgi:hypothetical protein